MLRFPARPELMAWVVGLAFGGLLAHLLAGEFAIKWWPQTAIAGSPGGVFRLLLSVSLDAVLALMALKVAVETLLDTAHARLLPDAIGPASGGESVATDSQAVRQLFLLLGAAAASYGAVRIGGGVAILGVALVVMLLPAAIMLLAEDDSLRHALNPLAWFPLITRLGVDYAALAAKIALLAAAAVVAHVALARWLPDLAAVPLARAASIYLLFAGYHGIGLVMLRQHAALGLDIARPIPRPLHATPQEDACMHEVEALIADNKPAEAIACLARLMRGRGVSAPLHARYRQLLSAGGDRDGLLAHGRDYIAVLLALGKDAQAMALLHESLALDPAFELAEPEEVSRLVTHADATGQTQFAVTLAEQFLHRFPRDRERMAIGLLAARLMCGRLGREADACALLDRLLIEGHEHPLAPQLRALRAAIVLP